MNESIVISRSEVAGRMSKISTGNAPRIAIVGCGAIAELYYLPALAKHPAVLENLVLVDTNEARLQELASTFGVRNWSGDYHQVLTEVDGVIVAVPHHLHYPITMDFLAQRVHVLCEKPVAETSAEAREMVKQAERFGVTLSVNNTRRLFPAYAKIKELIAEGVIGKLISIDYVDGEIFEWPTASGFYFKKASPTGVLLDRGAHGLDTICWWLGGKPTIRSSENDSFGGVEGVALVKCEYNGCAIKIKLSWLTKLHNTFTIVGELGTIVGGIEEWDKVTITYKSGKVEKINLKAKEIVYTDFADKMVDNFIAVAGKGVEPYVPAREVLLSLEMIEECYSQAGRLKLPWYETLEASNGR